MSKHNKIALLLAGITVISAIPHSAFAVDNAVHTDKADTQQLSDKEKASDDFRDKLDNNSKVKKANDMEEKQTSSIGWNKNNDGTYSLIDGKGNMIKSNWCKVGGKWYYFDENGTMKKGWIKSDGKWFWLDNSGNPKTGWILLGESWYYLNTEGAMEKGWNIIEGKWYFFNDNGQMLTGWQKINSKWYYFDNYGKMLSNTVIDGYTLGPNGEWI